MKKRIFLYFINDDRKTFNIVGPISSDIHTTRFTAELQSYGLNVRISTTDKLTSLEEAKKQGPHGFTLDPNLNWYKDNMRKNE